MSSGLQHKMYDYEVAPPAAIWEKIAAELDESELANKFPSALYTIQIAPPAHSWQAIAAALDEPALVNDYAAKLNAVAIAPPANVWNKIKISLDAEQEAAIPEHRRFSPFLKYAAAAAIFAFLAWGGIRLFNDQSKNTGIAKEDTVQPGKTTETVSANTILPIEDENIAVPGIAASMEEARNDAALEASKKTYAKLDVAVTRSKIKNAADFFFVADEYDYTPSVSTRGLDIGAPPTPAIDMASRYIMLMTPDGYIIRMSKKLGDLVCCVSGEDQDKDCIDQLKKWREKIANPGTSHSSSNFMDILNMVNSMQDN